MVTQNSQATTEDDKLGATLQHTRKTQPPVKHTNATTDPCSKGQKERKGNISYLGNITHSAEDSLRLNQSRHTHSTRQKYQLTCFQQADHRPEWHIFLHDFTMTHLCFTTHSWSLTRSRREKNIYLFLWQGKANTIPSVLEQSMAFYKIYNFCCSVCLKRNDAVEGKLLFINESLYKWSVGLLWEVVWCSLTGLFPSFHLLLHHPLKTTFHFHIQSNHCLMTCLEVFHCLLNSWLSVEVLELSDRCKSGGSH